MNKEVVVSVKNVNKKFVVPHEKTNSLKWTVFSIFRRSRYTAFEALEDINFEVNAGEFYGIVGRNGSGKSTLLKILAQIYHPTSGEVKIKGRISPFIELGVGFNMELTGRENIYLNGAVLGLTRKEINKQFKEIVRFAEMEDFIDQKLKNYSSGMQVRLAFSIAIRAHKGILLVDEVLAVGDAAFQKKCFQAFYDLKKAGNTIIFVTHDMNAVKNFCDRVLIIDKSKQIAITDPDEAEKIYRELNKKDQNESLRETIVNKRWGNGDVKIEEFSTIDNKGVKNAPLATGNTASFEIKYSPGRTGHKERDILIGLAFFNQSGVRIAGPSSTGHSFSSIDKKAIFKVDKLSLSAGEYDITVGIFDAETKEELDVADRGYRITVEGEDSIFGTTKFFGEWQK